jgi:hypothetical protein
MGLFWVKQPTSNAAVKNAWSYTSTSAYIIIARLLIKNLGNFAFIFMPLFSDYQLIRLHSVK